MKNYLEFKKTLIKEEHSAITEIYDLTGKSFTRQNTEMMMSKMYIALSSWQEEYEEIINSPVLFREQALQISNLIGKVDTMINNLESLEQEFRTVEKELEQKYPPKTLDYSDEDEDLYGENERVWEILRIKTDKVREFNELLSEVKTKLDDLDEHNIDIMRYKI